METNAALSSSKVVDIYVDGNSTAGRFILDTWNRYESTRHHKEYNRGKTTIIMPSIFNRKRLKLVLFTR